MELVQIPAIPFKFNVHVEPSFLLSSNFSSLLWKVNLSAFCFFRSSKPSVYPLCDLNVQLLYLLGMLWCFNNAHLSNNGNYKKNFWILHAFPGMSHSSLAIPFSSVSSWPCDRTPGLLHFGQIFYCLNLQGRPYPFYSICSIIMLLKSGFCSCYNYGTAF